MTISGIAFSHHIRKPRKAETTTIPMIPVTALAIVTLHARSAAACPGP
jgi:hypothetical protein